MGLFGPDKLVLNLEKYNYTPGETIKGTIKLNLKKPVQARKLEVAFIGRRIDKQSSASLAGMATGSRHHSSTNYTTVFDFKMPVAGEKEYQNDEYPFEIKIPSDILRSNPTLQGKLGQAATAIRIIAGASSRIDWFVKAELDVPMKLDINKSQKIILSES